MRFEELSRVSLAASGTLVYQRVGGGLIAFNLDAHPLISLNDNRRATLNPAGEHGRIRNHDASFDGGARWMRRGRVGSVARNGGGSEYQRQYINDP